MADEGLGLAEAINGVRRDLIAAQRAGTTSEVRFVLGDVEVEFVVEVSKERGGEASIKVLNLLSIGGRGALTTGETPPLLAAFAPAVQGVGT